MAAPSQAVTAQDSLSERTKGGFISAAQEEPTCPGYFHSTIRSVCVKRSVITAHLVAWMQYVFTGN